MTLNSFLCFGTWGLSGDAYGAISAAEARGLIRKSHEFDFEVFDTAPLYGSGRAEKLLGTALKSFRDQRSQVVTKFGMYPKPTGILQDYTPKATLKSVQCSLRNLQGQRVDVWLAHSPPLSDPKVRRSLSQSFSLLRDNGISGDFGISLGRISDLEWVNHFEGVSFAQINLSLMDQRLLEEKNLEIIRSSCIAVMARTVFNYGYLTSVPPETTNLRPGFHIRRFPLQMREIWLEEHWVWLQVARELELPLEHLAVLFVRSQPIVSCATLGIMSVSDLVSAKLSMNYALLDDEALFLIRETFSGLEARRLRAGVLSIAN